MLDPKKTMFDLCDEEPLLKDFLLAKGFPFSLDNPLVQFVDLTDVMGVSGLDLDAFLAEFEAYRVSGGTAPVEQIDMSKVNMPAGFGL